MLILASRSPRRQRLLRLLRLRFKIRPAEIPEAPRPRESPEAHVVRLAQEKALAVAMLLSPRERGRARVLGSDTVVAVRDRILGKPKDPDDARRMLRLLSGKTHRVVTGVAVWRGSDGQILSGRRVTRVRIRRLTSKEIDRYVASGEPLDAAGAYKIQGLAGAFIPRIEGCFSNVIGLPLDLTANLLERSGIRVRG